MEDNFRIEVKRTGGLVAFGKPLGGMVSINDLPAELAAQAKTLLQPKSLQRNFQRNLNMHSGAADFQQIQLKIWEGEELFEFEVSESLADVFDVCNEIVNEITRQKIANHDSRRLQIQAVFFDIGDTLVHHGNWMPGAKQLIADLKGDGRNIGLISNTGDLSRQQLADRLPDDFAFDVFDEALILLSSEVQISKPNPRIFELAISRSGIPPEACLFCGENSIEVETAESLGMKTLHFEGPDSFDRLRTQLDLS